MVPVGSDLPKQHQDDDDDQDGAEEANAAMTEAVTVTAEAATETTKQENDEKDDDDKSQRHCLLPLLNLAEHRVVSQFEFGGQLARGAVASAQGAVDEEIMNLPRLGME